MPAAAASEGATAGTRENRTTMSDANDDRPARSTLPSDEQIAERDGQPANDATGNPAGAPRAGRRMPTIKRPGHRPADDGGEKAAKSSPPPDPLVSSDKRTLDPETGRELLGIGPEEQRPKVRAPKPQKQKLNPDLVGKQQVQGSHVGDRYVRVVRQTSEDFQRVAPGHLVATEEANEARGPVGRTFGRIKRVLIGAPLSTSSSIHERLSKLKALAVLSSDALSSVAYATEAMLGILIAAGAGALWLNIPITVAIVILILLVGFSYRQTIKAYPRGGGSYIVAKDNLGEIPSLTAGASLMIDYTLTVAVSIASGVAALVSAVPSLHAHRVMICLVCIALVTIVNLRGVREAGSIFAAPTYLFLVGVFVMIGIGIVKNASEGFAIHEPKMAMPAATEGIGVFLILRAFSSGCSAMTGVEAISDGVPAFKPPEWKNARITLSWMVGTLCVMFLGIGFLTHQYGAVPMDPANPNFQTVVSQIAQDVLWGKSVGYYFVQFTTLAILVLAANTAFSDFPRLGFFLARDGFLPHQFTFRGDRLAYTTGIVTLGVFASILLVVFGGETDRLIPLYAVGVFTSFTLSQFGMVRRWERTKEEGWKHSLPINMAGAIVTGIVAVIIAASKFTHGAWIVVVLVPLLILMFRAIHKHYLQASSELESQTPIRSEEIIHTVIVPIAKINRIALQTLAYARSISDNVTAVHITDDEEEIEQMRKKWAELDTDVPLVIIESPFRSLVGPLLTYLDEVDKQRPDDTLTVVLPEYVPRHWWEQILHNQTALRIKAALLFRPGTVVISVPYHLARNGEPSKRPATYQRRF
jgi:amino acid transporter